MGVQPHLKLQYDGHDETAPPYFHQGACYHRIYVLAIVEDAEIARIMEGRWREGTVVVDALTFRTYFYTTTIANTVKYLNIRQKETETRLAIPGSYL